MSNLLEGFGRIAIYDGGLEAAYSTLKAGALATSLSVFDACNLYKAAAPAPASPNTDNSEDDVDLLTLSGVMPNGSWAGPGDGLFLSTKSIMQDLTGWNP
jgi:hypothetical protein